MGQYYRPVNLDKQEFVWCREYGSGAKLMEHSWLQNPMVNAVVLALSPVGSWYRDHLVWAGDYMDEGLFTDSITDKRESDLNLYQCCATAADQITPPVKHVRLILRDGPEPVFIVNHDTREFVRLSSLPEEDPADPGWQIHPLPLLTCSGNGRGGGDFSTENSYTGSWSGHSISAEYDIPENYTEIRPDFTEQAA
jgi:hypothetical protein